MNKSMNPALLAAVLVATLGAVGCNIQSEGPVGELQTEAHSVKLGNAKSAQVEIHMGVGELKVSGGAKDLLEGDFAYNVARWKPEIDYHVAGGRGSLTIRQPEVGHTPTGNARNEWDLRVNDKVPLELDVELGAGKSTLTLGSLSLSKLVANLGVGVTVVDLTGEWQNNLDAQIHGGVGEATIRLPQATAVRVHATGGIGEIHAGELKKDGDVYVNDAKSDVTLRVNVEGGIGEIHLELAKGEPVV